MKNLVLNISGGIGKCIMSTAVIRNYKLAFPESEIVVVSGYPEVFLNNPDVFRNYSFQTPYLWRDYYSQENWKVYAHDPYLTEPWIKGERKHLIEIWSDELGIDCIQKTPLLFFSSPEVDELNSMIRTDRPLVVVQSSGGSNAGQRSWTRTPPKEEFDEFLKPLCEEKFVLHLAVPETPILKNVHQRIDNLDRRKAMLLIYGSDTVVGIDSFGLHARAANPYAGPSTFFFVLERSRERLGYSLPMMKLIAPRPEIQEAIENHHDYFANVFQYNIESPSENCPISPTAKWFDF